ncbi:hypothetical protein [Embleya sp. NPDC005971]|uniref:hypothetical protein n=1 Tax=Embleya sp. NPDC005971 TaxID=3156724 RepID=UPI0033D19D29
MRKTILNSQEWLAQAADHPQRCINEWDKAPLTPYPLAIGKIFDLVTVHRRVGERVLAFYDRESTSPGGTVLDVRAAKIGFLVYRNPARPPLTVALACDAKYRTRCPGLKGYLLASAPLTPDDPDVEKAITRWLRPPGYFGLYTFRLDALAAKLAEVAREGKAFPPADKALSTPSRSNR